ncbi:NUDIX domain-containing protein [Kitasatospora sp. NPDC006697]|uniref:NUDIX hydrolase n=1 Tax=Kitasatospora sp. NPDC006697 TaxID=3364020 RepID=UPI0036837FB8
MTDTAEPDPDLKDYLAAHAAPAACVDALIRDGQGRVLIVDPVYKPGWDLPGGMLEDEEPVDGLTRELREELGLTAEIGRLLVHDTVPPGRWGRTILALVYAAHPKAPVDVEHLPLQRSEIREARFATEQEAMRLLAAPVAARLAEASRAERGAHTAVLRNGRRVLRDGLDYYRQLPAPMAAATVLVRDTEGRILVLDPRYKDHAELPGGMVAGLRLQSGRAVPAWPRPDLPRLRRRTAGPRPGPGAALPRRGDPCGPVAVAEGRPGGAAGGARRPRGRRPPGAGARQRRGDRPQHGPWRRRGCRVRGGRVTARAPGRSRLPGGW